MTTQRIRLLEAIADKADAIDHQHSYHGLNEIGTDPVNIAFAELFEALDNLKSFDMEAIKAIDTN